MKVYTVKGIHDMEINPGNFVEVTYFYGVFSSVIKANKIANHLRERITEDNSQETIFVEDSTLNEPTEDYFIKVANLKKIES